MEMASTSVTGSILFKYNQPEAYEGNRDYLATNTWLYKMDQYLDLLQLRDSVTTITDENKIMFTSMFMNGNAVVWWYGLLQRNQAPQSWAAFKDHIVNEFVQPDHIRRSKNKIRRLK